MKFIGNAAGDGNAYFVSYFLNTVANIIGAQFTSGYQKEYADHLYMLTTCVNISLQLLVHVAYCRAQKKWMTDPETELL